MLPTITIASPISNRERILKHYLECLLNIDYPIELISFHFILNKCSKECREIIKNFKKINQSKYKEIKIDFYYDNLNDPDDERIDSVRLNYTYQHLSNIRNKLIKSNTSDYLFSCDSDILVKPNILRKLLAANKPIVSSLIYNGYILYPNEPHKYPNILKYDNNNILRHVNNYWVKNAPYLEKQKLLEVDCAGAVILIHKDVCKTVNYGWHNQGEDIYFSNDCKKHGYPIFCDVSSFSQHIMSEELLDKYLSTDVFTCV